MVKTFLAMGKILTSRHNHLFVRLTVQLFAPLFHQKAIGFDSLSRIAHLVHLLNQKAGRRQKIYFCPLQSGFKAPKFIYGDYFLPSAFSTH
ncbi:hypothetical protein LC653_45340 [Nostoc sp. CHAB 5784]|uniref:hypothetical protein n=1 Tax=Nostoc mirabile TaxID=2907820 RepID=UPI001E556AD3|nr:hypothetical protein [Nostoc mirabile]MCC5670790.1 hypothetical protein [Nostoc mirabile CHAB5784]